MRPARNAFAAKLAYASDLSGLFPQLPTAESTSGQIISEEREIPHLW